MQKEGISKPVSFKCFNCNHQEIAWKDEMGMRKNLSAVTACIFSARRTVWICALSQKEETWNFTRRNSL